MSLELSGGALKTIVQGGEYIDPIVQVLSMKRMNAGGTPEKDRYRAYLSDGKTSLSFAMMSANTYIKAGEKGLPRFTIIKIVKYITSVINNTEGKDSRVLLIIDLEVLKDGDEVGEMLGDPVPYSDSISAPAHTSAAATMPKRMGPVDSVDTMSEERPSKLARLVNQPNVSQSNRSMQSGVLHEVTHPISSLSPYQNRWVIKARVIIKSDIRKWENNRGSGQLFNMDLADESGEIKCTGFGEMVDKYYNTIEVGKVYYISKCALKPANKQYNSTNNDYEMTMTSETIIEECPDEMPEIKIQYHFTPINKIAQLETNQLVDVIGVAISVGDLQSLTARTTGRELKKREIQLLDQSCATVVLTLWGTQAETFDRFDHPVIALKGARIGEFGGGKNLSTLHRTLINIDPDMPETFRLQGWYATDGSNVTTTDLSARVTGFAGNMPWMYLKEVMDRGLGTSELGKGDFFQCKATVLLFRTENAIYKACPEADCNKKVVDHDDGSYRCEKCDKIFHNFKYRFMCSMNVGDWSGNQWVSMFNDEAEKVLGMTSDEAGRALEDDSSTFREMIQRCHFQEYILKCRAKMEKFRDEDRVKIVAIRASPVNFEEYNAYLINNIKQYITD